MKLAPLTLALAAVTFAPPALAQDDLSQKLEGNVVARAASPDGRITLEVPSAKRISLCPEGRWRSSCPLGNWYSCVPSGCETCVVCAPA